VLTEPGTKALSSASFSRDGTRIVTSSADGYAIVWSTETSRPLPTLERLAATRVTRGLTRSERGQYLPGV
jgi:WD40 repeat protein